MKKILILLIAGIFSEVAMGQNISGPQNVCPGQSYNYTNYVEVQYTSVQWKKDGTYIGSGNSINVSFSGSSTLRVDVYNGSSLVDYDIMYVSIYSPGSISLTAGNACYNTSITLTNNGRFGSATWYARPSGGAWTNYGSATNINYTITSNSEFKVVNSNCGTATYYNVNVNMPLTSGSTITNTGAGVICSGANPIAISMVSSPGYTTSQQWEQSTNGGASWSVSPGTYWTTSYDPAPLYQTTYYRLRHYGCSGSSVVSNQVVINVDQPSVAGTLGVSGSAQVCNSGNVNLTLGGSTGTSYEWKMRERLEGGSWSIWSSVATTGTPSLSHTIATNSTQYKDYEFQAFVTNGVCGTAASNVLIGVKAYPYTVGGNTTVNSSSSTFYGYGVASGNVGVTGNVGTIYSYQRMYEGASNWEIVSSGFSISGSAFFRALVQSGSCSQVPSQEIFVKVFPLPVIAAEGGGVVAVGGKERLTLQATYLNYQWIKDGTDIQGATSAFYDATLPGVYRVRVQGSSEAQPFTSAEFTVNSSQIGQEQGVNYKVVTHFSKDGLTSVTDPYTLASHEVAQTVEYHDGFGRSIQSIIVAKSPNQSDIVQPMEYDDYGMQTKKYLPYVADFSSGALQGWAVLSPSTYSSSHQYLFYHNDPLIAVDEKPYTATNVEASLLNRPLEIGAPGATWQPGTGNTVRNNYLVNIASVAALANIKKWSEAGPGANYTDHTLSVTEITDENDNKTWTFTDKLGRTVLKRVELNETIDGANVSFLDTYYVYDTRGNLAMQIPPKASAKLVGGTSWSTAFRDEWCFVYTYDDYNRLIEKKVPDAKPIYYIYDPLDRQILMQDGNLRGSNKWLFTKYDINGRIAMMGIYMNATHTTRANLQLNVADALYPNANDLYYEQRGTTLEGYTNQSFPTANSDSSPLEILSVNYYDNYDFDNAGGDDFSYTPQSLPGEGTSVTDVFGMPTGSKRKILNTSSWLVQYIFYDKWNRAIQVRSNNQLSLAIDDLITNVYDFQGRLLLSKKFHDSSVANTVTTITRNEYDFAGRVLRTYQAIDNRPEILTVSYQYNKLGQVVEKNLHCTDCSDPGLSQEGTVYGDMISRNVYDDGEKLLLANQSITLSPGFHVESGDSFTARIAQPSTPPTDNSAYQQSVDYRYNIRGWLTSINNAQLNNDGSKNNDTNDFFGMELTYDQSEGGSFANTPFYNGNISAVKWKGPFADAGAEGQRSYVLGYDKTNKLESATYRKRGVASWDQDSNTLNESMQYDHNGNILKMERNTIERTLQTNFSLLTTAKELDNLTYTYASGKGNQLTTVEDGSNEDGFTNGDTQSIEYTYDDNGSLTKDVNKAIDEIEYNILGKPSRIEYLDGKVVTYNYDGGGNKLSMSVFDGVTLVSNTDYVSGYVYENGNLAYFGSPEGRVVKKGNAYSYQYAIADHQGNTRVLFATDAGEPDTYKATFEDDTQADELADFQNYPTGGGWRNSTDMWDHTDAGTIYTHSQLLNGANGGQVGLAKTLKVYPGDVISAKVYAKYLNVEGSNTNLTGLGAALTGAFGLTGATSGEALKALTALNDYSSVMLAAGGNGDPMEPKAFITVLLFDNNFNFVDLAYDQIDAGATTNHDLLEIGPKKVEEPGYAYIYISNEHPKMLDVYFDDMEITHTKTPVLQYNEYYPFGMQTAQSWTRENTTNNYLYNAGTEQNPTTGLYDLAFRNYDPVLGRMVQVDPLADNYGSWTPYKYGLNDPMYWSDPSGASESNGPGVIYDSDWAVGHAAAQAAFQRADDDFKSMNSFGNDMYGSATSYYSGADRIFPKYGAGPGSFASLGGSWGYNGQRLTTYRGQAGYWVDEAYTETYALAGVIYVARYAGVRTFFVALGETAGTAVPPLGAAIGAGAVGWKAGDLIGSNIDGFSASIARGLIKLGVPPEFLIDPAFYDKSKWVEEVQDPNKVIQESPEHEPENHFPHNNGKTNYITTILARLAGGTVLFNEFGIEVGEAIQSGFQSGFDKGKTFYNDVKNTTLQGIKDTRNGLKNGWPWRN